MMHSHDDSAKSKLKISMLVIGAVFFVELVGGIISNSLSLIGDAMHMMLDFLSLFIAWLALCLSARLPTVKRTFGYHRTEVFATLLNSFLLLGVVVFIAFRAVQRIIEPADVKTMQMLVVAVIGLAANLFAAFKLHGHKDMNVRGAYLHVIGDTLSSFAVIAGAILMRFTGLMVIDPIISLIIVAVLLFSVFRLLGEAFNVLLEGTPKGIRLDDVLAEMENVKGVKGVHSVHFWAICSHINVLSAHVEVDEPYVKNTGKIIRQINKKLQKFGIKHTTLQFECKRCKIPKLKHLKH